MLTNRQPWIPRTAAAPPTARGAPRPPAPDAGDFLDTADADTASDDPFVWAAQGPRPATPLPPPPPPASPAVRSPAQPLAGRAYGAPLTLTIPYVRGAPVPPAYGGPAPPALSGAPIPPPVYGAPAGPVYGAPAPYQV